MTLDDILSRPQFRRNAVFALLLSIFGLACTRYLILPIFEAQLKATPSQFLAKILEDLSTSITVTFVISIIVWWLTPKSAENAKVIVLDASELKREFKSALDRSDSWWFYGGCGRYFRSAVLSTMASRATADSSNKSLRAIILDPGNARLCEQHADYRAATSQGRNDGNWTTSRVKCELLATIVLCLRTQQSNGLLHLQISVSDRFSTFRADISNSSAIETREDPKAPALKCPESSDFYKALKTEYEMLARQSRQITDPDRVCRNVADVASLKYAVEKLDLPGVTVTAAEYNTILALINDPKNPHG
ncbi:hypothetical protein ACCD08_04425 [Telluria sp. Tellsp104]